MHWVRRRSLPVRVLVYAGVATLAFALAAGVGAMGALSLRGEVPGLLEGEGPRPADGQDASRTQQGDGVAGDSAVERDEAASDRDEAADEQEGVDAPRREDAEYVGTVGDIQARAVETFLQSHKKLLRYDALAAEDVQEMKANETALQEMADRAVNLDPPKEYEEHHEMFVAAIGELHEAVRLAHDMAADPVAGAELGFDEYDGHVNEASALLQRSNELLGKDYEAIEGVREISPEF
jgi:hypothetical protein